MRKIATMVCALALAAERAGAGSGRREPRRQASVGGQELVLNGAGIRTKAIFKVYVGSLYVPAKANDRGGRVRQGAAPRPARHAARRDGRPDGRRAERRREGQQPARRCRRRQGADRRADDDHEGVRPVKEGNVSTLDFVDGATKVEPQRRGQGHRSRASRSTRRCSTSGSATSRCRPISRRRCWAGNARRRYWPSCGYRLLARRVATAASRSPMISCARILLRPELAPVRESSQRELALHEALLADPRRDVSKRGARRDRRRRCARQLRDLAALSCAAARCADRSRPRTSGCSRARASTCRRSSFITSRRCWSATSSATTPSHGRARGRDAVSRADASRCSRTAPSWPRTRRPWTCSRPPAGFGSLGELLAQNRTPARTVDLDVLDAENAAQYWERDERHDFSVSLNRGRPALDALARVLERVDRAFPRRARRDQARARDRRQALGLARRARRRSERRS